MALAAIITRMSKKPLSDKDSKLFLGDVEGEQLEVLQYPIANDLLVSGPAGSGKTVLALKRHKRFVEERKVGEILVYTNILKDFISQKAGRNSHGIFKYIKDKTPVKFDDTIIEDEIRYAKFAEDAANWSKANPNQLYFLIVDEAQDLYLNLLEFCSNYAGVLNLLADDAQQLYKHGNCTTVILGKLLKDNNRIIQRLDLKGNYRNHETVANIANPFYSKRKEETFKWNIKDTRPILKASIIVSTTETALNRALLSKTLSYVESNRTNTDKIAVITQSDVNSLANIFTSLYPTQTTNNGTFNGANIFQTPDPVILTMHSAKGLEFEYILIANLDYRKLKVDFPENYEQLLFTSITRSRYSLSIFIKKEQTEFLNVISKIDKKYYEIIEV